GLDLVDLAPGQVAADGGPLVAALGKLEDSVPSHVEDGGIVRRDEVGSVPVEAEALLSLARRGADEAGHVIVQPPAHQLPALPGCHDQVRIGWGEGHGEGVAYIYHLPFGVE